MRRKRRSDGTVHLWVGLAVLGGLWALSYWLGKPAPSSGPNVTIIPPGEPSRLRLQEVVT